MDAVEGPGACMFDRQCGELGVDCRNIVEFPDIRENPFEAADFDFKLVLYSVSYDFPQVCSIVQG